MTVELSKGGLSVSRSDADGRWLVYHVNTGFHINPPGIGYRCTESQEQAIKFRDYLLKGDWDWNDWKVREEKPAWADRAFERRNSYRHK